MPDRSEQDVFFISQIGEPESDTRFRSDLVLNLIAKPAAKLAGFRGALRADEIDKPGRITNEVITRIVGGPAVIADLTGRNPNVYYEVALAHAAQVALVQVIDRSEIDRIPFDISDQSTIPYIANSLTSYELIAKHVAAQLEVAADDPRAVDNPVVTARAYRGLQAAAAEQEYGLAEVLLEVRELRASVNDFRARGDQVAHVEPREPLSGQFIRDFPARAQCRFVSVPPFVTRGATGQVVIEVLVDGRRVPDVQVPIRVENAAVLLNSLTDENGLARVIFVADTSAAAVRVNAPGTEAARIAVTVP